MKETYDILIVITGFIAVFENWQIKKS